MASPTPPPDVPVMGIALLEAEAALIGLVTFGVVAAVVLRWAWSRLVA